MLRKMINIVAPRYRLKLKCTKFDFGCGFVPDLAVGAHSAPQDFLAEFWDVLRLREKMTGEKRKTGKRKKE